jgi:hypothetical protein
MAAIKTPATTLAERDLQFMIVFPCNFLPLFNFQRFWKIPLNASNCQGGQGTALAPQERREEPAKAYAQGEKALGPHESFHDRHQWYNFGNLANLYES